jgi:TolA-binding protein
MTQNQDGWHISKSVPATLLLGLITQAAAIIWTVSMMQADIQSNSENLNAFSERVSKVEGMVQSQAISMARIDENIQHIRGAVEKMAQRDCEN